MTDIKPILRVAAIAQSAALAGNALRLVRKKKKKSKDFMKVGVETIIGSAIIAEESKFINSI